MSDPYTPSKGEVAAHEASTHANFNAWCLDCQKGLAQGDMHAPKKTKDKYKRNRLGEAKVPDCEVAQGAQTKDSIDHMKIAHGDSDRPTTALVMVNCEDGGVVAYAFPGNGIQGDSCWPKSDQVKSDQEPAIVVVQEEIRELRRGITICIHSPVGDFECNARAGNAIRRVEVKIRTILSYLERGLKTKLDMSTPFATWLVRRAGEALTKYGVGSDNKTAWERRHGQTCPKSVVSIGGKVL